MQQLWRLAGNVAFWAAWPLLWIYFRLGQSRTRVLIVAEGKVLLVKGWLGVGDWLLPGGGLHRGEDPKQGAVREVAEETGIQLNPKDLSFLREGTANRYGLRHHYISFVATLPRQEKPKHQFIEIVDSCWVTPDKARQIASSNDVIEILQSWTQG